MTRGDRPAPRLSCPFCGALDDELRPLALEEMGGHAVTCDGCGAIGPVSADEAGAVAQWNGAALQAPLAPRHSNGGRCDAGDLV